MIPRHSPIQRRRPIRKSSGRNRLTAEGRLRLAFCHEQPCMVHGTMCPPMVNIALRNRIEAHHVDHNHKDPFRTVSLCKVAHSARPLPNMDRMNAEVERINRLYRARYEAETGAKL